MLRLDALGVAAGVAKLRLRRLHPHEVDVRRPRTLVHDGVVDAPLDAVVALARAREVPRPVGVLLANALGAVKCNGTFLSIWILEA